MNKLSIIAGFQPKKNNKRPHTGEGGFSLLELMIAAAVLAIALAGVVTAMYRSQQVNDAFNKRETALQGARKMMSQIKSQDLGDDGQLIIDYIEGIDGDPGDTINEFDIEDLEEGNTSEGSILYTEKNGYIEVDVQVKWEDKMGEQQLSITSYLFTYDKS